MENIDIAVSSDALLTWCANDGSLNVASIDEKVRKFGALLAAKSANCRTVTIGDSGSLLVRTNEGSLAWYSVDLAATSTLPPSTSSSLPTSTSLTLSQNRSSATSRVSTTETSTSGAAMSTVNTFEELSYCMARIGDCQQRVCAANANETLQTQTCLGLKCVLYCIHTVTKYDCWSVLPDDICRPARALDQPCDADCAASYAGRFGPPPRAPGPAHAPGPADDAHTWLFVGLGIGAFWLVVVAAVACYVFQKRKSQNRYVLLELDDSDDENRHLLG